MRLATLALLLFAAGFPAAAGAGGLWLHVRVDQDSGERTRVTLNLPADAVRAALPHLRSFEGENTRIHFDGAAVSLRDLGHVVASIERDPSRSAVVVRSGRTRLEGELEGEILLVRIGGDCATGGGEIRMPYRVAAALVPPGGSVDPASAIREMISRGEGDILLATADGTTVRVWIDRQERPQDASRRRRR
jgi:hypothetical protein